VSEIARTTGEERRLHVDGERPAGGERRARGPARVAGGRDDRAGVRARARASQLALEQDGRRQRELDVVLGAAQGGGHDEVPDADVRGEPAPHADERDRGVRVEPRRERRACAARVVGPHPDDVGAADGERLDPQRGQDAELCHRPSPRYRPSAVTGNTSR